MAQHADLSQYLGYGETGLPLDGRPVRNMDAPHSERHSSHGDLMRNFIIGFSDGLTVPFALTAGLSSLGSPRLVILAGLAELFSGAISMGLGAYLAAVSDAKQYAVEEARERAEIVQCPLAEEKEIYDIFAEYGIYRVDAYLAVERLKDNPDMWLRFMMDFELKLSKPNKKGAWIEGSVMGISYLLGGLLPMIPYFAFNNTDHALFTSIGITVVILIVFGFGKSRLSGDKLKDNWISAGHTLLVGVVAAGASYGIVRALNSSSPVGVKV
ncbi:hypothetical protein E4T50_16837 [Aureobasidium sp. EXF-12298]|nr:hypothetical protein E4T50_16837 [Aureobasidium sp. EXF-12298]KAI4750664.1 hypothetical protein E4T51_16039 [Aureobasidium sp. EXF-12344]KAI4767929.1 hypothetical protein E4T52_16961 [Aureobasidium sp. EXF-3400]